MIGWNGIYSTDRDMLQDNSGKEGHFWLGLIKWE